MTVLRAFFVFTPSVLFIFSQVSRDKFGYPGFYDFFGNRIFLNILTFNTLKYIHLDLDTPAKTREPVEIRIYPDSLAIINYGGPDRSLKMESFIKGVIRPRRYRNRRLGDFLKELDLTEGRATGIPIIRKAIKQNGSPNPGFDTDENRSYFMILFHVHERFKNKPKQSGGTKVVQSGGTKVVQSGGTKVVQSDMEVELTDRQKQILELFKEDPNVTVRKIASILNLNPSAVQKHLTTLKQMKIIQRIGGTRGY